MRVVHFSIAELNLNHDIQNVRFLNALIVRDTAIQKFFVFVKRDASNVQETINCPSTNCPVGNLQASTVYAKRNPRTLNVSYAKATIQSTTEAVWFIRIYKEIFCQPCGER